MPAPTVCSRPAITRRSSCWHAARSWRFRSARSAASGTGTQWLRRKYPASPSMPPFSCGSAGVQNSASNRQCERNATKRAVSSAAMSAQDLLHRRGEVVIAQLAEHAAKVSERQFVRFQKRLLRRVQISAVKRRSAGHAAHREHLQLDSLAGQIGIRFVPIDLRFHAPGIALRNAGLAHHQAQRDLPVVHILREPSAPRSCTSGSSCPNPCPRSDAPCAAVCAALSGRLPESRR